MVIDLLIYIRFIYLDLGLDLDSDRVLGNPGWPHIHYVAVAGFEVLLFLPSSEVTDICHQAWHNLSFFQEDFLNNDPHYS